jgi:thiol:disulfide interchange protein DsbA
MFLRALLQTVLGMLIAGQALAFDEGIDFTQLAEPQATETGDKIEVLEVFMYSCPHCYHLEPDIDAWLKTKPENVEFRRMPAIFGPKVEPHARAFYAAELMGVEEKFHMPLFSALHDKKLQIWDEDALVAFAEQQGIDGAEFRAAYNSFYTNMKVRRATEMGRRYGIDGVPAVVVNGKYRTSPSQTGSREGLVKVIDYLIGVESGQVAADQGATKPAGGS